MCLAVIASVRMTSLLSVWWASERAKVEQMLSTSAQRSWNSLRERETVYLMPRINRSIVSRELGLILSSINRIRDNAKTEPSASLVESMCWHALGV